MCVYIYIYFILLQPKPDPAPLLLELHHVCWRDPRDKAAHTGDGDTLGDREGQELWDTSHL